MKRIYRLVLVFLLLLMFRTPLLRLQQTTRQLVKVIPETIANKQQPQVSSSNMSRPNGLIAKSGLELLTFGTPNGMVNDYFLEHKKHTVIDHDLQDTRPPSSSKSSRRRMESLRTSFRASTSARTSRRSRGSSRRVPMAASRCSSTTTMVA